ncbi:hypothetical protein [Xanthomonas phaseoli]|uniref:hypothetical protein n=1 Tax=Xanthomonas phaseoli TaxID=1985254 RepID=UPI000A96F646|nr:hypothetical protein [Xanthomonas phaseoli]
MRISAHATLEVQPLDKKFSAGGQAASNAAASASPPRRPSAQAATQAHGIKKTAEKKYFFENAVGPTRFSFGRGCARAG